jgi:hypothetical protein
MKIQSKPSTALIFAFLIVISISLSSCSSTTTTGPTAATPFTFNSSDTVGQVMKFTSSPMGKTFTQWSVAWWQWAYGTPATQLSVKYNALLDGTGALAANGQVGSPVFFLCGRLDSANAVRSVSIPSTSGIFLSVLSYLGDTVIYGPSATTNSIAQYVGDSIGFSLTSITVRLDGVTIPNLTSYSVQSDPFSLMLPNNNLYQFLGKNAPEATVYPAIARGFYLMFVPLSKGVHNLNFSYANTSGNYHQIKYIITSY